MAGRQTGESANAPLSPTTYARHNRLVACVIKGLTGEGVLGLGAVEDKVLGRPGAVARALVLSPGNPFVLDSMGWVEYKMGRKDQALDLLQQAYDARPDPEIGAHLGEVLWQLGQRDRARAIWREAIDRAPHDAMVQAVLRKFGVTF